MTQRDMEQLLEVNVALTAERDREKFLTMVLDAAMAAARCDGGTLYLLDRIAALEGQITEEQRRKQTLERGEAMERIRRMNSAEFLSPEDAQWAEELAGRTFRDESGEEEPVLTRDEADCLRIRRGTLTPGERRIMEAHVKETRRILSHVHFPREYRDVPSWASAHHEFLDGTGYPDGLSAERIPLEVRLMTILDIFDSLVASDRPYRKPRTAEEALGVLKGMGEQGKLDAALVKLFEESRAWEGIYV